MKVCRQDDLGRRGGGIEGLEGRWFVRVLVGLWRVGAKGGFSAVEKC